MPTTTPNAYPGTPGTTLRGGLPTPSVGGVITTLSLVNETMTEQAGGFVTPMFGQSFVQGDIPAGEWPQFETEDSVPCAYTHWGKVTWPDGSLKFMAFLVRFPQNIPALGSKPLRLLGGGGVPTSGGRSLSDVTAADIKTELTGVTNLSGQWDASLNTAITDAQQIVTYGNGAAGAVYRVYGDFKQSGSAHGQLGMWSYLAVLQDSSGNFMGIRYLGRFGQVFADINSPTKTYRDCTAQLKSGATVIRQLQGITTRSGNTPGTLGNTFRIPHWTTCGTCGEDARWDFIQGGGSSAADCTVRVVPNKEYAQQSLIIPPFDLSLSVTDTPNEDYYINGKGNHTNWALGTAGEYDYIGLIPAWAAKYWINPNAQNEKQLRVNAMAAFGYEIEIRKSSTLQLAVKLGPSPVTGFGATDPTWWFYPEGGNYAGITAPTDNQKLWQTESAHRPAPCFPAYVATGEPQYLDHMLAMAISHTISIGSGYKNYKVARPIAGTTFLDNVSGDRDVRIDGNLPAYEGAGLLFRGSGVRRGAWPMRDIIQAVALCPDTPPDGCDYQSALNFVIDSNFDCFNDAMALQPAPFQAAGMFLTIQNVAGQSESFFMDMYLDLTLCHGSAIHPRTNITAARNYVARKFNALNAVGNMGLLSAPKHVGWTNTGITESINELQAQIGGNAAPLTFSVASNNVTLGTIPPTYADWSFTNGDRITFYVSTLTTVGGMDPGQEPYAEITTLKPFYVVNASGKSFQLSETLGGAPLTVVQDYTLAGSTRSYFALIQNPVAGFSTGSSGGPQGYISSASGAANYHQLLGGDVVAGAAKLRDFVTFFAYDYNSNPKWKLTQTLPA